VAWMCLPCAAARASPCRVVVPLGHGCHGRQSGAPWSPPCFPPSAPPHALVAPPAALPTPSPSRVCLGQLARNRSDAALSRVVVLPLGHMARRPRATSRRSSATHGCAPTPPRRATTSLPPRSPLSARNHDPNILLYCNSRRGPYAAIQRSGRALLQTLD
jgi:hypothetical protein